MAADDLDTSPRRTRRERAELAVQRAQRDYQRRVTVHARAIKVAERAFAEMTTAAATLAHREADPALQDTGEES